MLTKSTSDVPRKRIMFSVNWSGYNYQGGARRFCTLVFVEATDNNEEILASVY